MQLESLTGIITGERHSLMVTGVGGFGDEDILTRNRVRENRSCSLRNGYLISLGANIWNRCFPFSCRNIPRWYECVSTILTGVFEISQCLWSNFTIISQFICSEHLTPSLSWSAFISVSLVKVMYRLFRFVIFITITISPNTKWRFIKPNDNQYWSLISSFQLFFYLIASFYGRWIRLQTRKAELTDIQKTEYVLCGAVLQLNVYFIGWAIFVSLVRPSHLNFIAK